jgi:hypothetical protein
MLWALIKGIFIIVGFFIIVMKIDFFYNILGMRLEKMVYAFLDIGGDSSTIDRLYLIQEGTRLFSANPILGYGLDNFRYLSVMGKYAHNNYIELACDLGLIGAAIYYSFIVFLIIKAAKKVFRNDSDTEEEIYVDSTYLKSIVDEYLQLSKILLDTLKEKERVVSIISSIKSFFEKSATVYYKDGAKYMSTTQMVKSEKGNSVVAGDKDETKYDGRRLDVTNVFFNYKYAQAKEIGNICINAMIEKVNALREATKFYGSTIRHAFVGSKKNISEVK